MTGGAGFIGANFVHHVLENTEHSVTVLDKLTYAGNRENLATADPARCELVVGDVADAGAVEPGLGHQGGVGPPGARVGALVRGGGRAVQLLQRLRPVQHVEKFVPRQITNVLTGQRPKLHRAGENVRDWIHVADHSAAVLRILESGTPGRTYLIGADGERDNLTVLREILRLMGQPEDAFEHVTDRAGHDRRYAIDGSRTRAELGWEPRWTDFSEGLADTMAWYTEHRDRWEPAKSATEAAYRKAGQRPLRTSPFTPPPSTGCCWWTCPSTGTTAAGSRRTGSAPRPWPPGCRTPPSCRTTSRSTAHAAPRAASTPSRGTSTSPWPPAGSSARG
ncbi:hypothetical protein KVA01_04360 [Kocuria varians]|uniref:dTDP-glucose 4,6-dehydratase n=1 Tax=Kocuria varians TaxID=1272 RepID=A0A4Y4CZH0_KOCVA|nr:hypothetical protein KVA01_04360 [Kocuria varians]